ncbi:unnamed protein product [Rotaria magnacalcarata]|uniref:Adenylate kinase n=1 Tax=Rotaria magnacalcarata TaxID=392030 RepID=A0A816SVR7_9BILA|nr:unnamed protein product [Rotaria magnacalcarata]CAF2091778.1 unnamed protein product [Rotaria magnacalcarata]CAF4042181.1 unnamed protein product [Rotaria magnacalcarata]CAF4066095.1 unnamed protein product [Rotaria magnacalcarata]
MSNPAQKIVLLIGPPGSGKGTLGHAAAAKLPNVLHISLGDFVRDEMQDPNSRFGKSVSPFVNRGGLVPDNIMLDILSRRLQQPDALASSTILLDGFPRTLHQAKALNKMLTVDRVVLLQAQEELCVDRINHRRIDPVSHVSYHTLLIPAPTAQVAARLVRRETDLDENKIRGRLQFFQQNLASILAVFPGKLFALNSAVSIQEELSALQQILSEPIIVEARKDPDPSSMPVNPNSNNKVAKSLCVVCMDEEADGVVLPCGHLCGCESCLKMLLNSVAKCPICRAHMNSVVKVFQSGVVEADTQVEQKQPEVVPAQDEDDGNWSLAQQSLSVAFESASSSSARPALSMAPAAEWVNDQVPLPIAVSIAIPNMAQRSQVDICCVIDVSGSMGEDAKFQDPNDASKFVSEGMNQLDIVKHSVKAVIHTLTDQDRLSLVAFHDDARSVFTLSEMNEGGKRQAIDALEALEPQNSTNIWAGLEAGLESLRTARASPRRCFILILTDGQPTVSPPGGENMALRSYFEAHAGFTCSVSTFGFGYQLKSKMLLDVAREGKGTFAFIPDAKIVGTCFVNFVANACTNLALDAKVHLEPQNGAIFPPVLHSSFQRVPWGLVFDLGPLHFGSYRDLIVPMKIPVDVHDHHHPFLKVTVEWNSENNNHKESLIGSDFVVTADALAAFARMSSVHSLEQVIDKCDAIDPAGPKILKTLIGQLIGLEATAKDARITALLKGDLQERISKAVSTVERYKRWGAHYLRAILRSHEYQMRTNFMDPGLQVYGGVLFSELVHSGGEIFKGLPLKKYSDRNANSNNNNSDNNAIPAAVADNYYAGNSGGCFSGECVVQCKEQDGMVREKQLSQVRSGDCLQVVDTAGHVGFSPVLCLAEFQGRFDLLVLPFSRLALTPTHPLRIQGSFVRPCDMSFHMDDDLAAHHTEMPSSLIVDRVFNVVLQHSHVLLCINGMEAVTLGHGFMQAFHPFYSTKQVLTTLEQRPGWKEGHIIVAPHHPLRNQLEY